MKTETDYETRYVEQERKHGHLCPKLGILGEQGWPDRMVLTGVSGMVEGLTNWLDAKEVPFMEAEVRAIAELALARALHFVEFKAPGGEYQPRQQHVIRELRARGFRVDIIEGDTLVDLP